MAQRNYALISDQSVQRERMHSRELSARGDDALASGISSLGEIPGRQQETRHRENQDQRQGELAASTVLTNEVRRQEMVQRMEMLNSAHNTRAMELANETAAQVVETHRINNALAIERAGLAREEYEQGKKDNFYKEILTKPWFLQVGQEIPDGKGGFRPLSEDEIAAAGQAHSERYGQKQIPDWEREMEQREGASRIQDREHGQGIDEQREARLGQEHIDREARYSRGGGDSASRRAAEYERHNRAMEANYGNRGSSGGGSGSNYQAMLLLNRQSKSLREKIDKAESTSKRSKHRPSDDQIKEWQDKLDGINQRIESGGVATPPPGDDNPEAPPSRVHTDQPSMRDRSIASTLGVTPSQGSTMTAEFARRTGLEWPEVLLRVRSGDEAMIEAIKQMAGLR